MRFSIALVSAILSATAIANPENGLFTKRQSNDTDYELKKGPLDTPWTEKVGTNPWPEYPRPQLQRTQWKNLNGVWRYRNAAAGDISSPPFGQRLEAPVLVPFCLESALSGVMAKDAFYSWYQTNFDVPADWNAGDRVLLNFGAVDYNATVFVNGKNIFNHVGGYWAFTIDVTEHLSGNGTNELLVFVHDPTDSGDTQIPLGKQTKGIDHIFYTPCSGIWQTVWLESAPAEHVTKLDVNADMNGKVDVTVYSAGNTSSVVKVELHDPSSNEVVATGSGNINTAFQFTLDSPDLWTPDTPTLYNLTVTLGDDTIHSYTAFRTVSRGEIDGVQRPLLNGEFVFWFGTLDQGYWPDGLHSPPSVEAMVYDLKTLKEVGYNMLRKHIKVEPALFYRACDELGLMLIQDMVALRPRAPDPRSTRPPECRDTVPVGTDAAQQAFETQLDTMIHQLKNYPSIVSWMIYNEGWGQRIEGYPEFALTEKVRKIDPTRLVNAVSGWNDHGAGDFHDNHKYPYPQCGTPFYSTPSTPYDPKRIALQGEFGGLGQNVSEENAWKVQTSINMVNATYELSDNLEIWNYRTHELLSQLRDQVEKWACSGAVWTQTTDVEGEVNGMLTYDRRINRMDKEQWKADIQALYDAAAKRGGVAGGNKTRGVEKFRMMGA